MAFSTWLGSTSVFHKPARDHRFHFDLLAQGPAQQSVMSRMTRPRLTERGSSAWRRAKASSWPVRREPRDTAPIAFCSRCAPARDWP